VSLAIEPGRAAPALDGRLGFADHPVPPDTGCRRADLCVVPELGREVRPTR
jgi:hypothetical protein